MHSLRVHLNSIHALIIRDLMARFGRHHLGFIWTVLEPMILATGVMGLWSLIKEPVIHGVPVVTFVLTGYLPLTLWRHLTNPMVRIFRNNAGLLYHSPVSHADILLARTCLEFLSTTAALIVIYFVVVSLGIVEPIADLGLTLAGWLSLGWYFGAMGMIIGAWTEYWEPAEKFIQPMQYLLLPISGVFFLVDWLPIGAQRVLLLNPSVHCFEMFRAGFLGEAVTTHYSLPYIAACSFAMTIAGAAVVRGVRNQIQFR